MPISLTREEIVSRFGQKTERLVEILKVQFPLGAVIRDDEALGHLVGIIIGILLDVVFEEE